MIYDARSETSYQAAIEKMQKNIDRQDQLIASLQKDAKDLRIILIGKDTEIELLRRGRDICWACGEWSL